MVAQPEDLRRKLGSGVGGEDGGASETCERDGGSVTTVQVQNGKKKQTTEREVSSPLGIRREDQTSCAPQSGVRGGQLMTGYAVFPDMTGPRPLLLPATATKTVGTPSPEMNEKIKNDVRFYVVKVGAAYAPATAKKHTPSYSPLMRRVSSGPLCAEVTLRTQGMP